MKRIIALTLLLFTLCGCRKQEQYITPRYDEIQKEFKPTAPKGTLPNADDTPAEGAAVTPFVPFS